MSQAEPVSVEAQADKDSAGLHNNNNNNNTCKSPSVYYGDLQPTSLYLSSSPTDLVEQTAQEQLSQSLPQRLYLPRHGSAPCSLDVYLKSIPSVASRVELLFQNEDTTEQDASEQHQQEKALPQPPESLYPKTTTATTTTTRRRSSSILDDALSQKCLNVLQGEVAHATPHQADILVSAEATTCHVLALRSTCSGSGVPLASMAHIDQTADQYSECLEKMVLEHLQHHRYQQAEESVADEDDDFGFYDFEDNEIDDNDEPCLVEHHEEQYHPQDSCDDHHHHHHEEHDDTVEQESFLPQACPHLLQPGHKSHSHSSPCLMKDEHQNLPQQQQQQQQQPMIDLELHIVGGYLDSEGTSQALSTSLLHLFSRLADKYQHQIRMSLSTAAISSLNSTATTIRASCCDTSASSSSAPLSNNNKSQPKSRGLAMNIHTGQVFPVTTSLPTALEGPALEVRSARLWSNQRMSSSHDQQTTTPGPTLAVIHTAQSRHGCITIEPFDYQPQPQLDVLLQVSDDVLLQVTSTSPQCESDRFCSDLRRTLSFVNTTSAADIFSQAQPLTYSRSSQKLNEWVPTSTATSSSSSTMTTMMCSSLPTHLSSNRGRRSSRCCREPPTTLCGTATATTTTTEQPLCF